MTIYLLYRPDHYDILYRGPIQIQVLRAASFTQDHSITNSPATLSAFSNFDYRSLAMIPGLGGAPPSLSSLGATGPPTLNGSFVSILQHPQASWVPQSGFSDAIRQPIQARAVEPPLPADMTTSYPLRFSQEYYKFSSDNSSFPEPSFTTATFRNSHFNKAHYNNPDFHPEEWRPEEEAYEKTLAVRKGKNKAE
jgi:ubiquitin thioesterase protein OTUB1